MKKICIIAGIIISCMITGLVIYAKQLHMQKDLAQKVFRFHVLANSDSEEDQALKLKVKEEVIRYMRQEFPDAKDMDDTKKWAKAHLAELEEVAETVVWLEGYDYEVEAEVTVCEFPDKTYGDVTFPAGEYEALRMEIGEGEGQNWWCVLYPNLCFINSVRAVVPKEGKQELKKILEEDTYEMITSKTRFKISWFFF